MKFKKGIQFTGYLTKYAANLIKYPFMDIKTVFQDIYTKNIWNNRETVSGDSSTVEATEVLRKELACLVKDYQIKNMLDIPCGDFNWMKKADLKLKTYIGADIVESLIEKNAEIFQDAGIFMTLDICNDKLPDTDLIFCRDCLVHLSFKHITSALDNIRKSRAKYILITTFPEHRTNRDIPTGAWRALNFEKPPFNFPPPLQIINENFTLRGKKYTDKSMALWKIDDII